MASRGKKKRDRRSRKAARRRVASKGSQRTAARGAGLIQPPSGVALRRIRPIQPIRMSYELRPMGISLDNALPGQQPRVLAQACLTSDDALFHSVVQQVAGSVFFQARVFPDSVYQFLITWHADRTLDLYLNDLPSVIEVAVKRKITAGQLVKHRDIADVRALWFEGIDFDESDSVLCCLKVAWKFGVFFDFLREGNQQQPLNLAEMRRILGRLYRHLSFQGVYDALGSEPFLNELLCDGWFPFVELLGPDFDYLCNIYRNKFEMASRAEALVALFDQRRLEAMTAKWWRNPVYRDKRRLLEAGIGAFLQDTDAGNILCIKTLLTEIEGVLRQLYSIDKQAAPAGQRQFIDYLRDLGEIKTEKEESLYFPAQFAGYLNRVIFGGFKPDSPDIRMSRHSSSHGIAPAGEYRRTHALQCILALDQILFYL